MSRPLSTPRGAFTLVEVVLAIGVFSVAGISSVALFSTIINGASAVTARDNAIRLNGALEGALQSQTFTNVYGWYTNASGSVPEVYAYTYLATPPTGIALVATNDPAAVAQGSDPSAGVAKVRLTPSIRAVGDPALAQELAAVQGKVYRVKFGLSPANPIPSTQMPATSGSYTNAAVLALTAQFYVVGIPKTSGANPDPAKTQAAVHSCTVTYFPQQ